MPSDWCPSIYNLWARASQRRALSKRINSLSPNKCIFNRDQSTHNKNTMSNTQSIYKSVLGLNETGGTIYLANPSITTYVWTITTHYPYFGMPPNQDPGYHPNEVKISGLRPPSSSSISYRWFSYSEWDKPGLSEQLAYIKNKCYTNTTTHHFN